MDRVGHLPRTDPGRNHYELHRLHVLDSRIWRGWNLDGDSKSVTIEYCEAYDMRTTGSDGSGFDLDGGCQDCIIQYCYAHDNDGHGFMMYDYDDPTLLSNFTGNVIRYNVSVNNCKKTNKGEIIVSTAGTQPWSSNYIYNNTCYNDRSGGQLLRMGDGTGIDLGVTVANNVFVAGAANSPSSHHSKTHFRRRARPSPAISTTARGRRTTAITARATRPSRRGRRQPGLKRSAGPTSR